MQPDPLSINDSGMIDPDLLKFSSTKEIEQRFEALCREDTIQYILRQIYQSQLNKQLNEVDVQRILVIALDGVIKRFVNEIQDITHKN